MRLRDRSKKTCQRLWEGILDNYRQGHCFTDFWVAYRAVIPEEQHTCAGYSVQLFAKMVFERRSRRCQIGSF